MGTDSKKPTPHQESLFDDAPKASAAVLVTLAASERPLNSTQRTFNRLTARIRREREALAAWEAFIPRFQNRVASELEPVERKTRDAQRRIVRQLEALLAGPRDGERLSRKYRAKVRSLLLDIVNNLLAQSPDAELEALYDRYSDVSHAEVREASVKMAEDMVGGLFGSETVHGHEAQDVEELWRHASEKITADAARAREKAAERMTGRAAERRAEAAREASASVRDIYRRLVSALHPDRETDAAERERKTGLMQRANQAYERDDLLGLLTLQIEIEQIDARTLSSVPEVRLRHYNKVLLDQADALDAQVEERVAMFRMECDLMVRKLTPEQVDQALSARISEARAWLRQTERDSKRLADPRQRRAVLDELLDPGLDIPDLEDLDIVAAAFRGAGRFPPRGNRRRKRRR